MLGLLLYSYFSFSLFLFLLFFSDYMICQKNCDPVTVQLNRTCYRESTELENLGYYTHNITKRKVGEVNFFFFSLSVFTYTHTQEATIRVTCCIVSENLFPCMFSTFHSPTPICNRPLTPPPVWKIDVGHQLLELDSTYHYAYYFLWVIIWQLRCSIPGSHQLHILIFEVSCGVLYWGVQQMFCLM